jgi:hypothetical protein
LEFTCSTQTLLTVAVRKLLEHAGERSEIQWLGQM